MNTLARPARSAHALDPRPFEALFGDPGSEVSGALGGVDFTARIAIPDYGRRIARHYAAEAGGGLAAACARAGVPFDLERFGLVVRFAAPVEIAVHDETMHLDDAIRGLVGRFGPVILRNATVDEALRGRFHRNIFPPLRFHVDRGPTMPNQISCFTRDPFDAEQKPPRASSTLFIANIVAWLESVRGSVAGAGAEGGMRPSYDLFDGRDMAALIGDIVLEQPWAEPEGTGEIAILDNRTTLHATWHKDGRTAGYRIGARYLT